MRHRPRTWLPPHARPVAGALATVLAGVTEGGAGIATGAWMLAGAIGAQLALHVARRHGG